MRISNRSEVWLRAPAVAGRFYPSRATTLAADVDHYVGQARAAQEPASGLRQGLLAVAAPHAGYVYSGPTAGYAYSLLDAGFRRVVLLGPAHYVAVSGLGTSSATAWRTPLGEVPLDGESANDLAEQFPWVGPADAAHEPEHSLEVQVPFLQRVLESGWELLPLIVGRPSTAQVADVIAMCLTWPETVVVVSTDLSHYLPYDQARRVDEATLRHVLGGQAEAISDSDACGAYGLRGMIRAAELAGYKPRLLDARNSGDTAGDRDRVVGYAAVAWLDPAASGAEPSQTGRELKAQPKPDPDLAPTVSEPARAALLRLARNTIMANLQRTEAPDWRAVAAVAPECAAQGAAFVTLRSTSGDLLGCIGSLAPRQALARDVAEHAYDAAFRDPRFPPMDAARAANMKVDISVLGPTRAYAATGYQALVANLQPGTGLVVTAGHHRATFLPAVWETLPTSAQFVSALWRKAGMSPGDWPRGITLEAYGVTEFGE